jgi:hypothetical protein
MNRNHTLIWIGLALACSALLAAEEPKTTGGAKMLPVRGLHCFAPSKADAAFCEKFIREVLPKEGVNTLVLEFNYSYAYRSHPELGDPNALDAETIKKLLAACKEAGVKLIPQFNCLGHQSWAKHTFALLKKHPEFDETPHVPADNTGIYCREWCPLHPDVHKLVFDLIDELADACEADAVHVGMDETFLIGDSKCPRCAGKDKAELFAGEVKTLHDHLTSKKRTMWMWGDRYLDGKATRIGKWEASENGTHPAIDRVPKDVVICDWHYEKAHETPKQFVAKGFPVLACPWKKPEVALGQLKIQQSLAGGEGPGRPLGMLQTTWIPFTKFAKAYYGEEKDQGAVDVVTCFKALYAELRRE